MYLLGEQIVDTDFNFFLNYSFPGVLTALSDSITEEQQMDSTYDLWFLRNQMW